MAMITGKAVASVKFEAPWTPAQEKRPTETWTV